MPWPVGAEQGMPEINKNPQNILILQPVNGDPQVGREVLNIDHTPQKAECGHCLQPKLSVQPCQVKYTG